MEKTGKSTRKQVNRGKRYQVCQYIGRGNTAVLINKELDKLPNSLRGTGGQRVPGMKGVIKSFDIDLRGLYYNIEVEGEIGLYHIDEFELVNMRRGRKK